MFTVGKHTNNRYPCIGCGDIIHLPENMCPATELIIYRMLTPILLPLCKCPRCSGGKDERFTKYYLVTSLKRIAANAPRSGEPYRFSDVTENVN